MAKITILLSIEETLVDKAKAQAMEDFGVPISQTALARMLFGSYGDKNLPLEISDLKKYSPESFSNNAPRRKNRR